MIYVIISKIHLNTFTLGGQHQRLNKQQLHDLCTCQYNRGNYKAANIRLSSLDSCTATTNGKNKQTWHVVSTTLNCKAMQESILGRYRPYY